MKYLAVMVFVASVSLSCFGQDSKPYRTCMANAKTQSEMDMCANEEAQRADAARQRLYASLLSKRAGNPVAFAKIKVAENAWITYRHAYIEAMYPAEDKQAEYGSMFPMEADLVYAELTQRHISELKNLEPQPGDYMPSSGR